MSYLFQAARPLVEVCTMQNSKTTFLHLFRPWQSRAQPGLPCIAIADDQIDDAISLLMQARDAIRAAKMVDAIEINRAMSDDALVEAIGFIPARRAA